MIFSLILLGVAASILLSGFFSAEETAAYSAHIPRLQLLADEKHSGAAQAIVQLRNLSDLITTTLIGNNLAVYIGTFLLTREFEDAPSAWIHANAEVIATLILTPLFFLFAEVMPKRLSHARPNWMLMASVRPTAIFRMTFRPLGWLMGGVSKSLHGMLDRLGYRPISPQGRDRLMEYLDAGVAEGLLSSEQHQSAQRIITLQEMTVGDIMIPFDRAIKIREDVNGRDAAEQMLEAGYNRATLVDRNGRALFRNITMSAIIRSDSNLDQPVANSSSEAERLDTRTSITKALRRLREQHVRLAIVTGRGGSAVGIVTVSDMISTIMGTMTL